MKFLSYFSPQKIDSSSSSYNKRIEVVERNGKNELLVNGIQQTGPYTQKLWQVGLRPVLTANKPVSDILVFGVGGGTVFPMLGKVFTKARMVGVDVDAEIIRMGKKHFGLDATAHLTLKNQDARIFASDARNAKKYDLVIIDLYTGNDVPTFAVQKPFLLQVSRLVRPDGRIVMNYFHERNQISGSQTLFDIMALMYRHVQRKTVLRNIFFYTW